MMTHRALLALVILAFTATAHAFAQTPSAAPAPAGNPSTPPTESTNTAATGPTAAPETAASTTTTKKLYCPEIAKLKKIDMFWGAPGGWRSYSQSFVNSIASFSGAQWVGINVGKMLCVYKGNETFEFPVVLQNDTLTPIPEGEKWIKQPGGYINCLSGEIQDCAFKFQETTTDIKNVYKELDFFKNKTDYLKDDPAKPK